EILVLCFNAILFVLLAFLILRDWRKHRTRWGGRLYPASIFALALFFVAHLANHFAAGLNNGGAAIIYLPEMAGKYLIPPLVFHLFYRNEKDYLRAAPIWQTCLVALYALSAISCAFAVNTSALGWFDAYPGWLAVDLLGRIVMVFGAVGGGLALWLSRRPKAGALERNQQRWLIATCGLWLVAFLAGGLLPGDLAGALEKLPPLIFVFVITYYVKRLTFFDVLIKKGAFVFLSLCLLTLYFVFFAPVVLHFRFNTWIGSLAWALSVWPIVLLAPWGHRKLAAWLDRRWLDRPFSPAEATKHFLDGLEGAISETELAQRAGEHLETIFRSKAEVSFDEPAPSQDATSGELMTTSVRLGGRRMGEVRIYPREQNLRFLSQDLTLLSSLANALAFLLENLRLREKRLEQEKRESELILNANRSELKALRAQVNPHFLFNALNTIAALIPRHPDRAEETVEELAEVFRYALHRSEREWVRLGEELDAIEAYLHVEQARFGDRLQFQISAAAATRDARIPAMIVQTIVENAVKHGIAALTVPGVVAVRAGLSGSCLRIEVRDTGPGFSESALSQPQRPVAGYGLRNVSDRLLGYFGDAAHLSIGRDPACDMTLVSIEMPLAASAASGAAS
ncbi:MAG TPA: histidine kinase, partial [Bryobacteraceae bacterium]|nr:histidine kinase [Bryobacteraceae bacterium]